ncbi:hypothetical protein ACFPZ3_20620 [Nonomuraea insulae]|uniref:Uncharacterized protein n=2 Tax=Nonomuraea insulae TaxID=1616787 RepID=A0ABW1CKM5_9ACTN
MVAVGDLEPHPDSPHQTPRFRILLADNRAAQALAELLRSLDHLDGAGWTEQDFDDLTEAIASDNAVALTSDRAPAQGGGGADQAGTGARDEEELPEPDDAETYTRPSVWGVVVTCDSEAQQVQLLNQLAGQGWNVRALM